MKSRRTIHFLFYCLLFVLSQQLNLNAQNCNQLYGVAQGGGRYDQGVIFHLDGTGAQIVDYSLPIYPGKSPYGDLVAGNNGKFYGMTVFGELNNNGVIFEWDPNTNNYTEKINFDGPINGSNPWGNLTFYNGRFYGMTHEGGSNDMGVIFEWDPVSNDITKMVDFDGVAKGNGPIGSLALYNGKFYGTTYFGGNYDKGVLFEWDPSTHLFTKKVDFDGINSGASSPGSLTLYNGKFFGTTCSGGINNDGIIFEWNPATNNLIKVVDFENVPKGSVPFGSLTIADGKLYGMTSSGGANSQGVIFELDPVTLEYSKKIDFNGSQNGSNPYGSLVYNDGKFYGMTSEGGANGEGLIFEWDPNTNVFDASFHFNNVNGGFPQGSLVLSNGKLFGMTCRGGLCRTGVIFEWNPATAIYSKKIDFSFHYNGSQPTGSLVLYNGRIYGMTQFGGTNDMGVLFEWDPVSKTYSKKVDFDGTNKGSHPVGSLSLYQDKFYGMTTDGGAYSYQGNGYGVLFEWDPVTNIFIKKIDFDGPSKGKNPHGSLCLYNGKFYGMTYTGGYNNMGTIFEWDPATNLYVNKKDFIFNETGARPIGSLTLFNGEFYGMTSMSGADGFGVIFKWNPVTNIYTKKVSFANADYGSTPFSSLTLKDGKFYGMTHDGGIYGRKDYGSGFGVIFEWDPSSNLFTKKIDFDGIDKGKWPSGSLTLNNGLFYGFTGRGGVYGNQVNSGFGVIFKWDPQNNTFSKLMDFDGENGSFPDYAQFTVMNDMSYSTVWTGAINTNWFNASNWTSGIPDPCTNATIPANAPNYPTLISAATCANLTIENGASLIGSEFLTITSNQAIVTHNLTEINKFHFVSSPVVWTTFNAVFPENQSELWAYRYDEPSGNWINQGIDTILHVGTGYSIRSSFSQNARFKGQLNSTPVTLKLSNKNSGGNSSRTGWNLLGNPFPSAIYWDGLIKGPGTDDAVYCWNGSNYISYVDGMGELTNGIIPPSVGFFVRTNNDNESLIIPLNARIHENSGSVKETNSNLLTLKVQGSQYTDRTFIHLNENSTGGFDSRYDAYKLWGISEAPQIYSITQGGDLSINSIPAEENNVVSLGFKSGVNETYTLSADGMKSFNNSTPIWLEDLKMGTVQNLSKFPEYTFNYLTTDPENRFMIRFIAPDDIQDIGAINIFTWQNQIIIRNRSQLEGIVKLYDITGRELLSASLYKQDETRIPVSMTAGAYVVKVISNTAIVSKKIFLN